jgi:hypothetical protein
MWSISMLLDPDPHSQDGFGSRIARSTTLPVTTKVEMKTHCEFAEFIFFSSILKLFVVNEHQEKISEI